MFTTFFLQENLKKELEEMFSNEHFKDKDGNMVSPSVYKQFLPVRDAKYTEESQEELESGLQGMDIVDEISAPFIVVILPDGTQNTRNKPGKVNVILYLGIVDKDENRAGYESLLHIIQKICERFSENTRLGKYQCGEEILWQISEKDEHPYYYGVVVMEFETPAIVKEDRYC